MYIIVNMGGGKFCIVKTLYVSLRLQNRKYVRMNKTRLTVGFLLLIIAAIVETYYRSFTDSKEELYDRIDLVFCGKVSSWGESILRINGIPYRGRYDVHEYANKQTTTLLSAKDTIVISSSFFHPNEYIEYQQKIGETFLLLTEKYDINIADSLFKDIIAELGIKAESSVELKVRDLHQMFPTADSMYADAPFVKTFSSGSVEGYTTTPVGIGICNHALLYGHVKIPFSAVLSEMKWFGELQIAAIFGLAVLFLLMYYAMQLFPLYRNYRKDVVFIGNTCIDLSHKELYLWSGECRHITDTRMSLLQMLVEAAPAYKLSKEEVCRNIWNLSPKDAQARYNVGMTDMRTLFIAEDPSLELKSLPREGMQLLVNESLVKKGRWHHFLRIYMKANSSK